MTATARRPKYRPTPMEQAEIAALDAEIAALRHQLEELTEQRDSIARGGPRRVQVFTVPAFPWCEGKPPSPAVMLSFRWDGRLVEVVKDLLKAHGPIGWAPWDASVGGWLPAHKLWYMRPGIWPTVAQGLEHTLGVVVKGVEVPEDLARVYGGAMVGGEG